MDLLRSLQEKKATISSFLQGFFAAKRKDWQGINQWGLDVLERLESFTLKGKMLRGSLVLWTGEMLGVPEGRALPAAAAMELLQSALLIHDDIMDKDEVRRGAASLHKQYDDVGVEEAVREPPHFGVSMAVCVGDLALSLTYEVLAECDSASLVQLFSELSSVVALGQMQDVFFGSRVEAPADQEVLAMYEHKTATYTFCLPFLLAVRLAGKEELSGRFNDLGVVLGKLFQLKDDELGLFGDDSLGKPLGSDLLLGKKTLYYSLLLSFVSPDERERLLSLQADGAAHEEALAFVKGLLAKYDVRSLVEQEVGVLLAAAGSLIDGLPVAQEWKGFLRSLVAFNQQRTK